MILAYQLWILGHVVFWNFYNHLPARSCRPDWMYCGKKILLQYCVYNGFRMKEFLHNLKRAIIAAEDGKFLEHEGFDFEAIQRAYEKNLKKGRLVAAARPSVSSLQRICSFRTKKHHGAK